MILFSGGLRNILITIMIFKLICEYESSGAFHAGNVYYSYQTVNVVGHTREDLEKDGYQWKPSFYPKVQSSGYKTLILCFFISY